MFDYVGARCALVLAVLFLSGCVTREQQEIGSISVTKSKFSFNVELVYDEKRLGQCVVTNAQPGSSPRNYLVPLEPNSAEVICTKNGTRVAQRTIVPKQWHSKIRKQRRTAVIGGLVGGGVVAAAVIGAGGASEKPIDKVPQHQRIYPPFVAVVPKTPTANERSKLVNSLDEKYRSYLAALPKDCQGWNRREMTALCHPDQIERVRQFEVNYVRSG